VARALAITAAVLGLLLFGASACSRCDRSKALATLLEKSGTVERDRAASVGTWTTAEIDAEFAVGDGVRTQRGASARLELDDGSSLRAESDTLIRFLDAPPNSGEQRLSLEMGEALLETADRPTKLRTDLGLAIVEPGTRIRLRKTDTGIRYEVSVGLARFEQSNGERVELSKGKTLLVEIGSAALASAAPQSSASAPPPSSAPASDPSPALAGVNAQVRGNGASAKAPGAAEFSALAPGNTSLSLGTTVRLPNGTTAAVEHGNQQAILRGAGEFVIGASEKPFIVASAGSVSLKDARTEIHVSVPGGTIVARLGSSADVSIKRGATDVSVSAGSVDVRGRLSSETLRAGERGSLGSKGSVEIADRGPDYRDFTVAAGDSFTVHDPAPPTAIGFETGAACAEGALVELQGRSRIRSKGTGTVNVLVPAGSHRYQVRCLAGVGKPGEIHKKGSITVLRDAGTARLPRTAPETVVDADGRNYTVLYQNLLPKISVRWPKAPKTGPYTLRATKAGGKTESLSIAAPFHAFTSGAFREGVSRLTFQAASGESSKVTTLDIRFDNAAPAASLTSPGNGQFTPGQTVTVAGTALETWSVSAGGKALPLDAQLRFSGAVATSSANRALAILFMNPRRGVHYYLRRGSGR